MSNPNDQECKDFPKITTEAVVINGECILRTLADGVVCDTTNVDEFFDFKIPEDQNTLPPKITTEAVILNGQCVLRTLADGVVCDSTVLDQFFNFKTPEDQNTLPPKITTEAVILNGQCVIRTLADGIVCDNTVIDDLINSKLPVVPESKVAWAFDEASCTALFTDQACDTKSWNIGQAVLAKIPRPIWEAELLPDGTKMLSWNNGYGQTDFCAIPPVVINSDTDSGTFTNDVLVLNWGGDGNQGSLTIDIKDVVRRCLPPYKGKDGNPLASDATLMQLTDFQNANVPAPAGTKVLSLSADGSCVLYNAPAPVNDCCHYQAQSTGIVNPATPPTQPPAGTGGANKSDGDTAHVCHPNGSCYYTCVNGAWVFNYCKIDKADIRHYQIGVVGEYDEENPPSTPPANTTPPTKNTGDTLHVCYENGSCYYTCVNGAWSLTFCKPTAQEVPPEVYIGSDTPDKADGITVWFNPATCVVKFCDGADGWREPRRVLCQENQPPVAKGGADLWFKPSNCCFSILCDGIWIGVNGVNEGAPGLVRADGTPLIANQGADNDSFCVQEPLQACDPDDGIVKPLDKNTEVLRRDAWPICPGGWFGSEGSSGGSSALSLDVKTMETDVWVYGPIAELEVCNPNECFNLLTNITWTAGFQITGSNGSSFTMINRVLGDFGNGSLSLLATGLCHTFSHTDDVRPNIGQCDSIYPTQHQIRGRRLPKGQCHTLRIQVGTRIIANAQLAAQESFQPVTYTGVALLSYESKAE